MPNVTLQTIREARERIRAIVAPSPVKESFFLEKRTGVRTLLKLENLNISGSFKIRGACNAILGLSKDDIARGVIAASAGNHAQGVAYASRAVGAKATIFMPERTPLVKIDSTRELGADVRLGGDSYDEAYQAALAYQKESGGVLVHAFADERVIAGQGTIGLELLEQIPDLGLVLVPIGGGGLASGIGCAVKESRKDVVVLGVQAAAYPSMAQSFKQGALVSSGAAGPTIADGIAVKQPSDLTFGYLEKYVDDVLMVDEDALAACVMDLMERDHTLAEGAGAASVAALAQLPKELVAKLAGKSIACIISGGNIDVNLLTRIIPNGMKSSGRFMQIAVRIPDRPGRLADLLHIVGKTGANLHEVRHDRLIGKTGFVDVEVHLDLETTNLRHQEQITETLNKSKFKFSVLA